MVNLSVTPQEQPLLADIRARVLGAAPELLFMASDEGLKMAGARAMLMWLGRNVVPLPYRQGMGISLAIMAQGEDQPEAEQQILSDYAAQMNVPSSALVYPNMTNIYGLLEEAVRDKATEGFVPHQVTSSMVYHLSYLPTALMWMVLCHEKPEYGQRMNVYMAAALQIAFTLDKGKTPDRPPLGWGGKGYGS